MSQHLLLLDFETYYADDYTLKVLTPAEYILDPRYETIMCSAQVDNGPNQIIDGPDFPDFITQFDPAETTTVAFNALFDNSILAWRYGFVPRRMVCTMSMARALFGHELPGYSLATISKWLGIGEKGTFLTNVKGLHREDIRRTGQWDQFADYALQDNVLNAGILKKLWPLFPEGEHRLLDLVLRCCIEPRFQCDVPLLKEHLNQLAIEKQALLLAANVDVDSLMSATKFQLALENLGVKIETKTSPTGKTIPAFAKTDAFMERLQNHEDVRVQALACARLGHKSTIEETRARRLLNIAQLPWHTDLRLYSGGTMPVPMRYGGAHTHRLSGDWGMNMQNLPTARGSKGKSKLRNALKAPPDHVVCSADEGQIEARLAAFLCGADNLLTQFRDKLDPYAILASEIFGFKVDRKVHKIEGFIGKTGVLGLQYGCGADHFYDMVCKLARVSGVDLGTLWSPATALTSVSTYRRLYNPMPRTWRRLDQIIATVLCNPNYVGAPVKFGPCEISYGKIELPNGLALNYADARLDGFGPEGPGEYIYRHGKFWHKIYGSKLLENIVQALARIIVMNAALRLAARGIRFVLQAHDELVFIIHKSQLEEWVPIIHTEMTRSPSWGRDLPLTTEVKTGPSYGEVKEWGLQHG